MATPTEIPILNQELRKLRLDAGLTQLQLAQLLGVEQPSVSVIEKGGNTSIASRFLASSPYNAIVALAIRAALSVSDMTRLRKTDVHLFRM